MAKDPQMPDKYFLWPTKEGIAIAGLEMTYDEVSKPKFEFTCEYLMIQYFFCFVLCIYSFSFSCFLSRAT